MITYFSFANNHQAIKHKYMPVNKTDRLAHMCCAKFYKYVIKWQIMSMKNAKTGPAKKNNP